MNREALKKQLIRHEGLRLMPYRDSVGKLTVGVGHNIEDKGISESAAMFLLDEDIDSHTAELDQFLPWWREMDEVRQLVIVDMAFNLGVAPPLGKLLGFKNTLAAMQRGDYVAAAHGMGASQWAVQIGNRATRLIHMMETGKAA